jgi:hypothetical protein
MSYPPPPPPPVPDYFRASDHEGALMVYRVKGFEPQYSAWSEPQPAVRCDVEAIDPPAGPWYDAMIGNELVVGQLKDSIGKTFFARLMKRGRAFVLDPISYGDEQKIDSWRQNKQQAAEQRPVSIAAAADRAAEPPHRTDPAVVPTTDDVPF